MASCDSLIYDGEGDCDPRYKVRFVYDMNMKYADAFPNEVKDVTLYVIDEQSGRVVLEKRESGEALSRDGYMMDIDVAPGDYTLLAWCGEGHRTSFAVSPSDIREELRCSLASRGEHTPGPWASDGSRVSDCLDNLYHGKLEAQNFPPTQGTHIFKVPLVKNTNDIHIVLQHLSGEPVDKDAFTFTITDENGLMDWDNSLLPDEPLTYFAWHTEAGIAGVEVPDYTEPEEPAASGRALTQVSAAVAEISVGRLVRRGKDSGQPYVRIYNAEGETVVSLPLIDYCLLVKGYHNREMSDQEFLDRQDDYSMVFFLDEDNRWVKSHIYINSWKIVLQETEL
ncbi:MAG: FimB/Mfa2 family fimbrial subunit [Muribaculaceae bacterium]|nr:FimB/Mfa2 family fimbrial subunit [Muribaculaceae bacterium]